MFATSFRQQGGLPSFIQEPADKNLPGSVVSQIQATLSFKAKSKTMLGLSRQFPSILPKHWLP